MQNKSLFILLLCSIAILGTNAAYFTFMNTVQKCIIEDLHQQDTIIAHYVNKHVDVSAFAISVLDPSGTEMMNQRLTAAKGKFSFTSKKPGLHKFCFAPASSDPFAGTRTSVSFEIKLTSGEHNHEDLANKDNLSQLQLMIMKIKDHADDFIKMQEQNREDESSQVEANQNVNERVIYTTMFQTVIILISGVYQIYSLRKYFIQKKLL